MTFSGLALVAGALVGAAIGALYLGLLWAAVRSLPRQRGGAVVFLALGLARLSLLIGALTAAAALALPVEGIAAAVAGFVAVRILATRLTTEGSRGDDAWR